MLYLCSFNPEPMQTTSRLLSYIIFIVFSAGLIVSAGCKKNETVLPPVVTPLMTLDFTDNYVNPKLGAIAFISDMEGNLLADTSFTGNRNIVLYPMAGKQAPGKFMVTIATWEPDMHNFTVTMHSWMYISPSEWRLKGNRHESTGQISVTLSNVPAHNGPVLFANQGFSNLTFNTTARVNSLYAATDDLYIRLHTAAGTRYTWQHDVVPGESYTVDMNGATDAASETITFPGMAAYYETYLYGYKTTDYENTFSTQADEALGDGTAAGSVTVSYPPDVYAGFHTDMKYIEDWSSNSMWQYHVNGVIPGAFKKIEASVVSTTQASQPPRLSLSSNGVFTLANATWQFSAKNNQNFTWTISGPDSVTLMALPKLPPSMAKMFPVLALDSLTYSNVELASYFSYPSYPTFVSACFNPTHPLMPANMEAASVRVTSGKK